MNINFSVPRLESVAGSSHTANRSALTSADIRWRRLCLIVTVLCLMTVTGTSLTFYMLVPKSKGKLGISHILNKQYFATSWIWSVIRKSAKPILPVISLTS